MKWYTTNNVAGSVQLTEIPTVEYSELRADLIIRLREESCHVANYFAVPVSDEYFSIYIILLNDKNHKVLICSYRYEYYAQDKLQSMAAVHPQLHIFEREITERYGIEFNDAPWDKPLRFPAERFKTGSNINNYPFYRMQGDSLHEVNVGPIHAGIIEPGVFRFICNGERVLHLEVALGFQHRGIESLICRTDNRLRQTTLVESIAGDSSIAHTTAYAMVVEKFAAPVIQHALASSQLPLERALALELERMAMHIADTGALCMDIGYQLGQVACEALRTIIINTTQGWCGNRFGKGLIRPCGTYYPLTTEIMASITANVSEVKKRYDEIRQNIKNTPSVLARFEECGALSYGQAQAMGLVGVAARASGVTRDVRASHPCKIYSGVLHHQPVTRDQGDVMARVMVRGQEVLQSADYILTLLSHITPTNLLVENNPIYSMETETDSLAFALVEGWRGEICHVGITDSTGSIAHYKIKDPSMHNWSGLALSVRGAGISDFPICNKSFNLSYCGHDL